MIKGEIRKDLDTWLDATSTDDLYENFVRKRVTGTCKWILRRDAFLDWVSPDFSSGTAKALWINGSAGYGKTMLCAKMIQHLSTIFESPVVYFFFSSNSESRGDPYMVIRSWISQIILSQEREAFRITRDKWEAQDSRTATRTDSLDMLGIIAEQVLNCTFVIDGLDECTWAGLCWEPSGSDSVTEFLEAIQQAVAHTKTRIMIVSRDEPEIRAAYHSVLAKSKSRTWVEYKICPEDVRSDAMSYSQRIDQNKLGNKTNAQRDELSQRMVDRCDAEGLSVIWRTRYLSYLQSFNGLGRLLWSTQTDE